MIIWLEQESVEILHMGKGIWTASLYISTGAHHPPAEWLHVKAKYTRGRYNVRVTVYLPP